MCRLQATFEILYLEMQSLPNLQAGVDIGARLTRWGQLQPSQRRPSPAEALIRGLESTGSTSRVHALCTICVTLASAPKCSVVEIQSVMGGQHTVEHPNDSSSRVRVRQSHVKITLQMAIRRYACPGVG